MVFRFVFFQMPMRSPLVGLQTLFLLRKGLYYMSANSNDSGETALMRGPPDSLLVTYVISTLFSCAD